MSVAACARCTRCNGSSVSQPYTSNRASAIRTPRALHAPATAPCFARAGAGAQTSLSAAGSSTFGACKSPSLGRRVSAAASSTEAEGPPVVVYDSSDFPDSAEQSVEQAVAALNAQLQPKKKKGKKGKKARTPLLSLKKLAVEIPVREQTADAQIALVDDILPRLPEELGLFNVVFGDAAAAELARSRDAPYAAYSLENCFEEDLEGPLIVVETTYDQAASVERLMGENWSGLAAIMLNAAWMQGPPPEQLVFAKSFDTVYCFQPLAVQTFMGTQEGAVFKWVQQGNAGGTKWQIFVERGGQFKCVGQQARRPENDDIETALYNAIAAESPITKGAKGLRGLWEKSPFSK